MHKFSASCLLNLTCLQPAARCAHQHAEHLYQLWGSAATLLTPRAQDSSGYCGEGEVSLHTPMRLSPSAGGELSVFYLGAHSGAAGSVWQQHPARDSPSICGDSDSSRSVPREWWHPQYPQPQGSLLPPVAMAMRLKGLALLPPCSVLSIHSFTWAWLWPDQRWNININLN